jgi:hypothetical protein
MNRPPVRALAPLLLVAWLAAAPGGAAAQSGGPFNLSWSAMSAGGSSTGGSLGLKGLVSPPNAGHAAGGAFTIDGGWGGVLSTIGVQDPASPLPSDFALLAPVPNPFTHSSTVAFELPRTAAVRVAVFDLGGRQVKLLVDRALAPGRHRVEWMGDDDAGARQPGGVYFVRMASGDFHQSSRIVLLH